MRIYPDVEGPLRTAFGHVLRGELEDVPPVIASLQRDKNLAESLIWCAAISGYVAIQACGNAWPADIAIHKVAESVEGTTRAVGRFTLNAADVYAYLSRSVLGSEPVNQVFPSGEDAVNLPILITPSMLITFCPAELEWWQYLDKIEQATETAASIDAANTYPAILLRIEKNNLHDSKN
jgi:hypothetical protein